MHEIQVQIKKTRFKIYLFKQKEYLFKISQYRWKEYLSKRYLVSFTDKMKVYLQESDLIGGRFMEEKFVQMIRLTPSLLYKKIIM